jgi:cytochrome P450 family 6
MQGKQLRKDLLCYAPFGDGPRICIGSRMGKMMTKVGLVLMLSKFNFKLGDEMEHDLKLSCGLILSPEGGINVKVIRR